MRPRTNYRSIVSDQPLAQLVIAVRQTLQSKLSTRVARTKLFHHLFVYFLTQVQSLLQPLQIVFGGVTRLGDRMGVNVFATKGEREAATSLAI